MNSRPGIEAARMFHVGRNAHLRFHRSGTGVRAGGPEPYGNGSVRARLRWVWVWMDVDFGFTVVLRSR